jgi:hypothetical protein
MANPILKYRNLQLLTVLLVFFLVIPFLSSSGTSGLIVTIYLSVIMFLGVLASGSSRRVPIKAICFGAIALLMCWSHIIIPRTTTTLMLNRIAFGAFFAYIAVVILIKIFQTKKVDANAVLGSACAYILIGFVWAFAFMLVEDLAPGSFSIAELKDIGNTGQSLNSIRVLNFIYLSFVTISTLGYGDILPVSRLAKMLCVQETIFGQLYIACLVARLVGLYTAEKNREDLTVELNED